MKDSELQIDRSCHVLYSKPCKKEILAKITLHYPEVEREAVWEQVQLRYAELLSKWRTDLGGKKNFHNGVGGTYDCIAIMCFYDVCRDVVTFREMEEIEENLILPSFRKLRFVDINKPFWKKLMYRAFSTAQKHCDTWHDYEMDAPIILLDEATASLDVENETAIQEALSRLIKNKTVLIIAHRMRTVAGADKVVVLKDGIVAEQGRPDELYARNGLYAHMVDLQSASQNWTI